MAKETKESILAPKRTVKYFSITLVVMGITAMIIWPLMDMLFSNIFGDGYKGWTLQNGILEPWIFAIVATVVEFVFWNLFHPDKAKSKDKTKR
jgi:hypothetical protein